MKLSQLSKNTRYSLIVGIVVVTLVIVLGLLLINNVIRLPFLTQKATFSISSHYESFTGGYCDKTTINGTDYCISNPELISMYAKEHGIEIGTGAATRLSVTASLHYGEQKFHNSSLPPEPGQPHPHEAVLPTIFLDTIESITVEK